MDFWAILKQNARAPKGVTFRLNRKSGVTFVCPSGDPLLRLPKRGDTMATRRVGLGWKPKKSGS
jgi:hypothetical protein